MSMEKNRKSIENLRKIHEKSLILNPTENIPFHSNTDLTFLEGMYIPEETRNENSKVIFAGRGNLNDLYEIWCKYMDAEDVTFKPHSGLDAHISIFMSLGQIGEKVLFFPEEAGGHFSTYQILSRLGFNVRSFIIDKQKYKVDILRSIDLIESWKPDYIFVDRSEGLYYEDFSWLKEVSCIKVFDASQYLTNIMVKDYKNPFEMGFDIILTSMHKNYPGSQKAAIFFKKKDDIRTKILKGLSIYISNIHPKDVCSLLLDIPSEFDLKKYSKKMLNVTKTLDQCLAKNSLPVVNRDFKNSYTQHIWLRPNSKEETYNFFKKLERLGILTNYRLLPYDLGYGLRLGTAAAIRQGLNEELVPQLANLIADIYNAEYVNSTLEKETKKFIERIKNENKRKETIK